MSKRKETSPIPELLARLAVGVLTDQEAQTLDKWRRRSAHNQAVYDKWSAAGPLGEDYGAYRGYDHRSARKNMERRIAAAPAVGRLLVRRIAIAVSAAAAVALIVLGVNTFRSGDVEIAYLSDQFPTISIEGDRNITIDRASVRMEDGGIIILSGDGTRQAIDPQPASGDGRQLMATLTVPFGHTMDLSLEDGTHVWLNAGSELRYPVKFGEGRRKVSLRGEGYFEVAEDHSRPFSVDARGQMLEVLGTQFNISAYEDENYIVTTLVGGSVRVTAPGGEETALTPNQQSLLNTATGSLSLAIDVDASRFTAWKDGTIDIEDLTLEQLLTKLSRTYSIRFVMEDDQYKGLVFQGRIPRSDDPQQTLMLIGKMTGMKFRTRNGTIYIE